MNSNIWEVLKMKFVDIPDYKEILRFLRNHNLGDFEEITLLSENEKDVCVELDFGDDEIETVTIRRRNGYNGNYRISSRSH